MKHKFSTLLYISANSSKIIFKTDLTFYIGSKLSLEYFVNHQNSLIGWIRVKWRGTFIAYKWFLPKIHTETSAFLSQSGLFLIEPVKSSIRNNYKAYQKNEKKLGKM